jgi:hypothetical protein
VTSIGFAEPHYLNLFIPLSVLIVAGFSLKWYLSLRFEEFFKGENISVPGLSFGRSWIKGTLLSLGFASMVLASGGPHVGTRIQTNSFMALVDISQSMWCEDYFNGGIARSRLETAMSGLLSLLDELPAESRFGLGVFAGRSDPVMILTSPQQVGKARNDLKAMVRSIHYRWTWEDGSSIRQALTHLGAILKENESRYGTGLTIAVLTDGEEVSGFMVSRPELETDHLQNVHFYFAGHGTVEGAPVPEFDENWKFQKYRESYKGETVVSRLDEENLSELAGLLNGVYTRIENDSDLADMVEEERFKSAVYESKADVSWALWLGSFVLLVFSLVL